MDSGNIGESMKDCGIVRQSSGDECRIPGGGVAARARRPYVPPRILSSETVEVVASTCTGPTAKATPVDCSSGPIQS